MPLSYYKPFLDNRCPRHPKQPQYYNDLHYLLTRRPLQPSSETHLPLMIIRILDIILGHFEVLRLLARAVQIPHLKV